MFSVSSAALTIKGNIGVYIGVYMVADISETWISWDVKKKIAHDVIRQM